MKKPNFVLIFISKILPAVAIAIILCYLAILYSNERISRAMLEEPTSAISYIQQQAENLALYQNSGNIPADVRNDFRYELLEMWEYYGIPFRVEINDRYTMDSSSSVFLKFCIHDKGKIYEMRDISYENIANHLEVLRYYSRMPDEYTIRVENAYLKNTGGYFIPGDVSIVNKATGEIEDRFNLLPEDAEGYLYYHRYIYEMVYNPESNPMELSVLGSFDFESVDEDAPDTIVYTNFFNRDRSVKVMYSMEDYNLRIVESQEEARNKIVTYGSTIFFIALILISIVQYMRSKSLYDIFEYRRKTTDAMAHDLKTPLAISSLYLENLKENPDSDKRDEYIDEIEDTLKYMGVLINDMLAFSRSQRIEKVSLKDTISLKADLEEKIGGLKVVLDEKNLKVTIFGEGYFKVNKNLWDQAVMNILTNAVKYSTDGSDISIVIRNNEIAFSNRTEDEIEDVSKLLEPFVKGSSNRGENSGSGLGLAVADSNFKKMKYKLSVEYAEERFTVYVRR